MNDMQDSMANSQKTEEKPVTSEADELVQQDIILENNTEVTVAMYQQE